MAAQSNTGFHHGQAFSSAMNQHAISFQSSAMDSTSEMILMGNYHGVNWTADSMMFSGNPSTSTGFGLPQVTSSSSNLLIESVPGLKHDAGFAVEWTAEEQYRLEEGLVKYADEPSISRYIKIAAMLRDKSVRDVALRCRWMTRKRRKQEDHNFGRKVKYRKDKLMESSSKGNISSVKPLNVAAYPFMTNHQHRTDRMSREALDGVRHLLEQNNQVLGRISANLSSFKLQDNVDLFCCTRNNIAATLNNMRTMTGIMSRMPPLPSSINEELANSVLPSTTPTMLFGLPSGIHLKQEPRC